MADDQAPALGTAGKNTVSRAELGAYGRRHGWGRDTAGAVFDDILAHREPYETAGETGAQAAAAPLVAADLTAAQCEALRRMTDEWGKSIAAVRYAIDITAPFLPAAGRGAIAAARDALKVLSGEEDAESAAGGSAPDDTGRVLPSAPERSRERAGARDGSEENGRCDG